MIQRSRPRVAYLCRAYAAIKVQGKNGFRGVMQFRTSLHQQLERDNADSLASRVENSDADELKAFYMEHYKRSQTEKLEKDQLRLAYKTSKVLFEVLWFFWEKGDVLPYEVIAAYKDVEAKKKCHFPYNILPLDSSGESEAIMQLIEVKAAVDALRNTSGLVWPHNCDQLRSKSGELDVLDWLGVVFGFQRDNVRNQREHLIMLLANVHVKLIPSPRVLEKLDERAVDHVVKKLFCNYKRWCKYINKKDNIILPRDLDLLKLQMPRLEVQQRKILYLGLHLLIWGEAANVRFMPECLCYIFHKMADELHILLAGNVSTIIGEFGRDDEHFLHMVITPIYKKIEQEAGKNKNGKAPHSSWSNYDDLNEYFWKPACFDLGWPIPATSDFLKTSKMTQEEQGFFIVPRNSGKLYFAETRSSWHIFRSFNRLWTFFILVLQALLIIAWSENSFQKDVFVVRMSSILVTAAILYFVQSVLDLLLNLSVVRTYSYVLRTILKIVLSLAWCLLLVWVFRINKMFPIFAWIIFGLSVVLAVIPSVIHPYISWLLHWFSEPQVYVGRGMRESTLAFVMYALFWIVLLCCKFTYSYFTQLKPLIRPTKDLLRMKIVHTQWQDFPPEVSKHLAVIALWLPVLLVYFMDTQIWYAIFSSICGGLLGAFDRLGEIRTVGMLRPRFHSLPYAFNKCLVPSDPNKDIGYFASKQFALIWNEIICCFREEDLISNSGR